MSHNVFAKLGCSLLSLQRDIERIHELVAQEERKAKIQATMDAAIPKFNQVCVKFAEAWKELQNLANEHDIRVVSPHNLQIPTGAKFKQTNSLYEGPSSIYITVER